LFVAAKASALVSLFLAVTLCGLLAYLFYSLKDLLGYVFTSDPDIIRRCSQLADIFAVLQFINGIQGASQGVMRGMNRQKELFGLTVFTYWLFGLPLGECVDAM
jgi:multidrug resistance protein, MATE family